MDLSHDNTKTGFIFDPSEYNIPLNENVTLKIHRLKSDTRFKILLDNNNPNLT